MPRHSVTLLSKRGLALRILSKLLYAVTDRSVDNSELKNLHQKILNESLNLHEIASDSEDDSFRIGEIPWLNILDTIADSNPLLVNLTHTHRFTVNEKRYLCAMICGLSGIEYELITGFKSQYNISWALRRKLGMPAQTTNLRNFLQSLSKNKAYESQKCDAQK